MGCDIHGYVEELVNDEWKPILPLYDDTRNYKRFSVLADVRSFYDEEGLSPKGIPEDISAKVEQEIDNWSNDAHSYSYLPLNLACHIFMSTEWNIDHLPDDPYNYYFSIDRKDIDIKKSRLVFWFDN